MEGENPVEKYVSVMPWIYTGNQQSECKKQVAECCNAFECDTKEGYADCNHNKRTKLDEHYSTSQTPVCKENESVNFGIENQVIDFENVQNMFNSDCSASCGSHYYTNRFSQHAEPNNHKMPCSTNFSQDIDSVVLPTSYFPLSKSDIQTPTSQLSNAACSFMRKASTTVNASTYPELMYQPETSGNDQGYISQSTCSYPSPQDGPEVECSAMDQGSQIDNAQANEDCFVANDSINWDYLGNQNQLEDLPDQFLNFFKNRIETEMHRFWGSMCDLLYEQQCHVQLIVDAAVRDCKSQQCTDQLNECAVAKNDSKDKTNTVSYIAPLGVADQCLTAPLGVADQCLTAPLGVADQCLTAPLGVADQRLTAVMSPTNTPQNAGRHHDHDDKLKHLLDIMTLSCSVSSLLARPQFKPQ